VLAADVARLSVACADRPGIVAAISTLLAGAVPSHGQDRVLVDGNRTVVF